ncbi:MAG: methyltransferase domain-containing protein, partial [Nostoc sp.]
MTQLKTLSTYDPTLFEGAAEVYAQYRTKYPPAVFDKLTEIFHLNGQGRLLDLGTGPGLIAIPLSTKFQEVVAIDPDPDMLKEAQRQAAAVRANNITWLEQAAELI